jgi:hypothetical protein
MDFNAIDRENAAIDQRNAQFASVAVSTLGQICRTEFPPLRWFVRSMIPVGFSILAAPAKTGKSFFVLQMAVAVAESLPFLRQRTSQAECLYLCLEAGPRGLKARLEKNKLSTLAGIEGIHVVTELGKSDALGFIEYFKGEHPALGLVVVDVLARVRPPQPNGPQYGSEYQELTPWRELAERLDVAVIGVTHVRKSPSENGDFLDETYGSGAMSGVPNGIIQIKRPRGSQKTVMKASFRDAPDFEAVLCFDKETCVFSMTDEDVQEASMSPERKNILTLLKEKGLMRLADIAQAVESPSSSVSNMLAKMAAEGLVSKTRRGTWQANP